MPTPRETTKTCCYLCSGEAPFSEMHPVASTCIGPCVDLALLGDWFCPDCFLTFQNSPHLRERVYAKQDRIHAEIVETVRQIAPAALRAMNSLPKGLRIDPDAEERLAGITDLNDVQQLQDPETQRVVLNVYRNHLKKPYFNPQTMILKDYKTLRQDFERLERGGTL